MIDATRTTTALLDGLHETDNDAAWTEFDARYRPIIFNFARKVGLSEPDAADVAQETLARFIEDYRKDKYDRNRGRLRSWLIGIAKYRIADVHRGRARRHEVGGQTLMVNLEDEAQLTQIWESERRAVQLKEAMRRLREQTKTSDQTIQAFELLVTQQMSPQAVAESLGISTHDVYQAKSRCAQKLREILTQIESAFDLE